MNNPNDIGKAVKSLLEGSEKVMDITRGRIYPVVAISQDTPCLVYVKDSVQPARVKANPLYHKALVTVAVLSQSYSEMVELSGEVICALDGANGHIAGMRIKSISWMEARDNYEEGVYQQYLQFEIKILP